MSKSKKFLRAVLYVAVAAPLYYVLFVCEEYGRFGVFGFSCPVAGETIIFPALFAYAYLGFFVWFLLFLGYEDM